MHKQLLYSIFSLFIFGFSIEGITQNNQLLSSDQKEIKAAFSTFLVAVQKKDNTTILDMMYPKLFDHVPKSTLKASMDQMNADTTVQISIVQPEIHLISDIIKLEDNKYAFINYAFQMIMPLEEGDDFTYGMFLEFYGEENIALDDAKNTIEIYVENQAFAIKESSFKDWTFLENKTNMIGLLGEMLPKELLEMAKPAPKACIECNSLENALLEPENVTSLIVNPAMHGETLEELPSAIGQLINLEILYLTDHPFKEVPKEIGALKKLKELSLSACQLESVPEEIFQLKNLKELWLIENPFPKKYLKELEKKLKKELPNTEIYLEFD